MIRHLTVLLVSYKTYSNEPYNNSYLINMLSVDRYGDIRKEYHTERLTETPSVRPNFLNKITIYIVFRMGLRISNSNSISYLLLSLNIIILW